MFNPRPMQATILKYKSGWMGVSAVPGSGKTHTLSALAAQLILNANLNDDQEILIVTLVNSAVDNFSTRIAGFIKEKGLLPDIGYRVRTLHGLAHDIVKENPEKAGVSERFTIVDESESSRMIEESTAVYLHTHPELELNYISADHTPLNRDTRKNWNDTLVGLNTHFISQAKDWQQDPESLLQLMKQHKFSDPLFDMAVQVYTDYQRGLNYRNAVDFSDLVRLAQRVLKSDPDYLNLLHYRWPYILEDEAQDSSQIQQDILESLVGTSGNWVRVGDPNQAIYETFTTASPKHLIDFLHSPNVTSRDLANSGRSSRSIIDLANFLIDWTRTDHPNPDLREALSLPHILPTDANDPQPNPPDKPNAIYIYNSKLSSDQEIEQVVKSLKKWLPYHPEKMVAVLAPIGAHGEKIVEALKEEEIPVVEMLKSSESTRATARIFEKILLYLADPSKQVKLAAAFWEIYKSKFETPEEKAFYEKLQSALKACSNLEDYLYPQPGKDWLKNDAPEFVSIDGITLLTSFRNQVRKWHKATLLPVDQMILTLAQDLFTSPADLALSHKLALMLEFNARIHPENQLAEFASELGEIAGNKRKFMGFSDDDTGFNPEDHKGEVFVSTYHKAKGLEWDRVYLLSVNNYDFPSAEAGDNYLGEKWYIKGQLNLEAEVLDKLENLVKGDVTGLELEPGIATQQARVEYSAERLRLLYVGITRAREDLIITWNSGRKGDSRMAIALTALAAHLEEKNAAA